MSEIQKPAQFELLKDKILGEGAYGRVYLCYRNGSTAAAKQFNVLEPYKSPEVLQEIEMIKELRNDFIIQFFGTTHLKGRLYLITSFAKSGSLYWALHQHTLPPKLKPRIITGLIKGMLFLKSQLVVHRDLKSPNVLLDPNYVPKICNFGLAKLKLTSTTHTHTSTSSTKGSTRWMAPELFETHPSHSFASDVYALGIVIWETLMERIPYADIAHDITIMKHISEGTHEEIPDSIQEPYKSIISSCWRLKPKDRITVEEINKSLPEADITLTGETFDEDISHSLQLYNADSSFTSSDQQSKDAFHPPEEDNRAISEPADYAKILDQYLQDTHHILYPWEHLDSVLDRHDGNFIEWIRTTAKQGNTDALTVLGEMHYYGCGVTKDRQAAFEQFFLAAKEEASDQSDSGTERLSTKTAKRGNSRAQYNLGNMYNIGYGVKRDHAKAVEWYTEAAENDNVFAQYAMGLIYYSNYYHKLDYNKAAEWLSKAAEEGYADAQYDLGKMYENGEGVSKSDEEAFHWHMKAAEQGYANAQTKLGQMYENGRGVPQSDEKAFHWYMKAADQGDDDAQFKMGWMYEYGVRVQQSDEKAFQWYLKATRRGNASAGKHLALMCEEGRGTIQSDSKTQFNLGELYRYGWNFPQNDKKAAELYAKAAEQGHADALYSLGWMYENGRGVPQSDEKAIEWYTKAAEQGNAEAEFKLEDMCEYGEGVQ